jgi:DNA-binding response OmpR family regulator
MNHDALLVLVASVSPYERRSVESSLKRTGCTTLAVHDAEDAARELAANGPSCVLVIDSGLLEAAHDAQWRRLRAHHATLRAVVRCLTPRANGSQRTDGYTLLVHPDDPKALRRALRMLAAAPSRLD